MGRQTNWPRGLGERSKTVDRSRPRLSIEQMSFPHQSPAEGGESARETANVTCFRVVFAIEGDGLGSLAAILVYSN
jgi:hypothetical protein